MTTINGLPMTKKQAILSLMTDGKGRRISLWTPIAFVKAKDLELRFSTVQPRATQFVKGVDGKEIPKDSPQMYFEEAHGHNSSKNGPKPISALAHLFCALKVKGVVWDCTLATPTRTTKQTVEELSEDPAFSARVDRMIACEAAAQKARKAKKKK